MTCAQSKRLRAIDETVRAYVLEGEGRAAERAPGQLLFGIAQGGSDHGLRTRSITELTKQNGLGWMTADQWSKAQDMLFEYDQIKQRTEPSKFYTDQFLKAIYRNGELIWP